MEGLANKPVNNKRIRWLPREFLLIIITITWRCGVWKLFAFRESYMGTTATRIATLLRHSPHFPSRARTVPHDFQSSQSLSIKFKATLWKKEYFGNATNRTIIAVWNRTVYTTINHRTRAVRTYRYYNAHRRVCKVSIGLRLVMLFFSLHTTSAHIPYYCYDLNVSN